MPSRTARSTAAAVRLRRQAPARARARDGPTACSTAAGASATGACTFTGGCNAPTAACSADNANLTACNGLSYCSFTGSGCCGSGHHQYGDLQRQLDDLQRSERLQLRGRWLPGFDRLHHGEHQRERLRGGRRGPGDRRVHLRHHARRDPCVPRAPAPATTRRTTPRPPPCTGTAGCTATDACNSLCSPPRLAAHVRHAGGVQLERRGRRRRQLRADRLGPLPRHGRLDPDNGAPAFLPAANGNPRLP